MPEPAEKLRQGERLRAIFGPNSHGPGYADPSEKIEEFRSVARALSVFADRCRDGRSLYYAAGTFGPPEPRTWLDQDETAYMEVWVETPVKGERPDVPQDLWQRWTWADGEVLRTNF